MAKLCAKRAKSPKREDYLGFDTETTELDPTNAIFVWCR